MRQQEERCKLVIVTAHAEENWDALSNRQQECVQSWSATAGDGGITLVQVYGARGVVPAFRAGIDRAASEHTDANVILLLHNDVRLQEFGWDRKLRSFYEWAWRFRLGICVGFSGAYGIGRSDIYKTDYDPTQLARQHFISNMASAESHGERVLEPRRVACFDGFSFSGPVRFLQRAFHLLDEVHQIKHHAYDTMLGLVAHDHGLESWFLPVQCEHYGGMTTTRPDYLDWAAENHGSDAAIWQQAHRAFYEYGKGKLPCYVNASAHWQGPNALSSKVRGTYRPLDMQFFGGR